MKLNIVMSHQIFLSICSFFLGSILLSDHLWECWDDNLTIGTDKRGRIHLLIIENITMLRFLAQAIG